MTRLGVFGGAVGLVVAGALVGIGLSQPTSGTHSLLPPERSGIPASPRTVDPAPSPARPPIAAMVGQKLIVRMDGTSPSESLLRRIRHGEVGGVILLGANITTRNALRTLTTTLHGAAREAGQPRLLIAVDQEGGPVSRIPWAPPTMTPRQLGDLGSVAEARRQGALTGRALRDLGIDVDFAPVADVPTSSASFLERDGRSWSFDPSRTSDLVNAFADGLAEESVIATMKHFPGLGLATRNTDKAVVTIDASAVDLDPGLLPYRLGVRREAGLIMLSNAIYPIWDGENGAGWSPAISGDLLRDALGYGGVTITDSLDGAAHARDVPTRDLALKAAAAGTDLILVTGSESTSAEVFATLVEEARAGRLARSTLAASFDRIVGLKDAP
jgi:beta-N-acetylhexosaminidase